MIQTGTKIPNVTVKHMTSEGIKDIALDQFCQNKKVVLFGVPGAYTPTCSSKHAPGFVDQSATLKAKGVDAVLCLSVNDPFVMHEWGKTLKADNKVMMLADGNATATKKLGLEQDLTSNGMGIRSQRYAMIIDNGVVKHVFVEKPGTCDVSTADHILKNL